VTASNETPLLTHGISKRPVYPADTTIVAPFRSGEHLDQFTGRVALYTGLDDRLHSMTRFFGAAALTNAALVELCSLPCAGRWAWRPAIDYFGVIGTALEAMNIKWARRIESGERVTERSAREFPGDPRGHDLDSSLVTLEQLEVERLLRQYEWQHSQNRALAQINWLLRWAPQLTRPLRHCRSIAVFRQVLSQMRAQLGRPANFALLDDRIGIGYALTRSIREPGCAVSPALQITT
jgi:hypothetical protein